MFATRRALLGSLAALPFAGACPALAQARPTDAAAEAALDAVFAGAAPPALAAGIVTREGLGWAGVRGVRRAGTEDAATLDDRWHLGSNTKAMTAAVFARLVDQGRARHLVGGHQISMQSQNSSRFVRHSFHHASNEVDEQ